MAGEQFKHLFISGWKSTHGYTTPGTGGGGDGPKLPVRDQASHSAHLRSQLETAWKEIDDERAVVETVRQGAYIEFEGELGYLFDVKSLERPHKDIRLCNVREEVEEEKARTLATVYVPNNERQHFLKLLANYAKPPEEGKKPKHDTLIRSIADIRRAVLESFWREDERERIPKDDPDWVEVWLNTESDEEIAEFRELFTRMGITPGEGELKFPERSVLLIEANGNQLAALIEQSDHIAEFRRAKEVATFFTKMENRDQVQRVEELLQRIQFEDRENVAICLLDHGVNNGHALLRPVLDDGDMHSVKPEWGTHDHHRSGHGTLMAGAAAYGDLLEILNDSSNVRVAHRLESSKIHPPPPDENPKALWGHVTAQGVSRAEIQAPERKRIICLAMTCAEDRERGRPSSWSAEVDAISSGYLEEAKRLVVVSAGNVFGSVYWLNYPEDNMTNEVHDPAQAWNALTVGAFTEKIRITDPTMTSWRAIAPAGGLSPYSTTSTTWQAKRWPIKPEVVFEGGNVARGPNDSILDHEDLQLLSTSHEPQQSQFAPFNMTSAATAQASRMAAQIQVAYPDAWPETVRGLLVHSADWTDAMRQQFMPKEESPRKRLKDLLGEYKHDVNTEKRLLKILLRVCGYGVPNLSRALHSLASSLTLISQAEMQPFDKRDGRYVTRDMHLYNLPWPKDALEALGEAEVSMRVTLSYFVEPGPGEVGYKNRYTYASHGLRFKLKSPEESRDEFEKRINAQARENPKDRPDTSGPSDKWDIGEARDVGSIHSDIWRGTAVELAASNLIAVHPTIGWWRERSHLKRWNSRCRYSLIVSIETQEQEVDIYTPVAVQLGVAIPIPVNR